MNEKTTLWQLFSDLPRNWRRAIRTFHNGFFTGYYSKVNTKIYIVHNTYNPETREKLKMGKNSSWFPRKYHNTAPALIYIDERCENTITFLKFLLKWWWIEMNKHIFQKWKKSEKSHFFADVIFGFRGKDMF